jgi:hypothetical protein
VTTNSNRGPVERGGPADVVYMLCLLQASFLLLGGLGEMLLMGGNPLYLIPPIAKMVLFFVLAAKIAAGRRWAMIVLVVVESITLFGFWIQVAAGALPWIDFTVNLVGLITNLAMPATLLYLGIALLVRSRPGPAAAPAVDPYAPAPLVTGVVAEPVGLGWTVRS